MNRKQKGGLVYSTDPGFKLEAEEECVETPLPAGQKLFVKLETKHRGGKTVTLVLGFLGSNNDLELLGKQLKNFCGTGGAAKDGEIIVQGDHRQKVLQWLLKNGYSNSKMK